MPADSVRRLCVDILSHGGVLAVLTSYSDRGAKDQAGHCMCVAAALFKPFDYDRFLHEWQPFLDRWKADAFHAADFYPGGGQFKRTSEDGTPDVDRQAMHERDSRWLPEVIARYVHKLFVVGLSEDEYVRVAPEACRRQFGGVHRIAAQVLTSAIGHWAKATNLKGDIAYFYELGDPEEAQVTDAYRKIFDDPQQRAHTRMESTPTGISKSKARGLDVADFLAWHWNKYFAETQGLTQRRRARRDIYRLMELLEQRNDRIEVYPLVGQNLVDFLISRGCERGAGGASGH